MEEVPAHWEVVRGKYLWERVDVRSETGEEDLLTVSSERGVLPRSTTSVTMFKAASYVGHKLCWPGDLVINSLWAWAGGLGVSQYHGIVSTAYGVYRLWSFCQQDWRYLHRLVRSHPFNYELRVRSKGVWTSRLQLTDTAFLEAPVSLPPLHEQVAIARFLDWVDERVSQLVDAKEKLVGLLEELRISSISEAVTGQVDVRTGQPYPAYRPSGIQWLGRIPAHWKVRRLGHVGDMRVSNVDKHSKDGEVPVLLCNYVDVYKNDRITRGMPLMAATARPYEIDRFRVGWGDVLLTKDSEVWDDIGVPALVEDCEEDVVLGYHLALVRPDLKVADPGYVFRALQSAEVAYQFHVRAKGVTRYGLTRFGMRSVTFPLPPLAEQQAIAEYLRFLTSKIDTATANIRREIDLLEEYRVRMIADVVTGKLDVREAMEHLEETAA